MYTTKEDLVSAVDVLIPQAQQDPDSVRELVDSFLELVISGLRQIYPGVNHIQMCDLLILTANLSYEPGSDVEKIYGAVKVFLNIYADIKELTQEEVNQRALSNITFMKVAIHKEPSLVNKLSNEMKRELGI